MVQPRDHRSTALLKLAASLRCMKAFSYMAGCCHKQGRKEGNVLFNDTIHFSYSYMASDLWLRTILIVRKETRCRHICYSYRLTARVLLYVPSHRQDSIYHSLCYTSCGALVLSQRIILCYIVCSSISFQFTINIHSLVLSHILFLVPASAPRLV